MLTLLTPSALLALLGLLVPVAIHLWNRRPGREVPVGSLRWLAAGANRRLRNLRLEQLGLLLLRAALLAVLALALAGPVWQSARPRSRGQVLLSPEVLGNPALATLRPTVDSLRRRGYGLRWLTTGFPKMSGAAWRAQAAGPRDSARLLSAGPRAGSFGWARVQQAADAFAGQPLYVLTPAALRSVQGPHPALRSGITWQTLPSLSSAAWLQDATQRGDSLYLTIGRSTESQTTFRRAAAAVPRSSGEQIRVPGLAPLRYQATAGKPAALVPTRPADGERVGPAATIAAAPLVIELYAAPGYAAEARYLKAALRAASVGFSVAPTIRLSAVPPRPGAEWLFWLTDESLPEEWHVAAQNGAQVWQEAAAPGVADDARLVPELATEAPVHILRRDGKGAAPADQPLWRDGRGRAVLSVRSLGQGALYRLHTRLDPAWSDLADNPALPARLLTLLRPVPVDTRVAATSPTDQALAALDQRALDPAQLPAARGSEAGTPLATTSVPTAFQAADLRPWLVLAAGILFALERLLAFRREKRALTTPL
ncbi:BatA domain-containing protein [Hymenobacter sp. BT523]|uniref:BatA domain-containing protein n=1 Tax=Hymenobacter sp. BT523 TaxID=2795725 RepID=UPI0018EAAE40|nr:BatA domain-containing protein [Hymenobacter sp. BT523]MBJ6109995.1 BatA domain-containing protein [Hymenobacter sp. BT523]